MAVRPEFATRCSMIRRPLTALLAAAAFAVALPATVIAQEHETGEETASSKKKGDSDERFCIRGTGSRVVATRHRPKEAEQAGVTAAGRAYTRAALARTGS